MRVYLCHVSSNVAVPFFNLARNIQGEVGRDGLPSVPANMSLCYYKGLNQHVSETHSMSNILTSHVQIRF